MPDRAIPRIPRTTEATNPEKRGLELRAPSTKAPVTIMDTGDMMKALAAIVLMIGLTGCASIIHHDYQDVPVTSHPSGVPVFLNHYACGKTPVVVALARGDRHTITMAPVGHEPTRIYLEPMVSPLVLGNILFGGLIGLVIDAATGGMYEYPIKQIHAQFPVDSKDQPATAAVYVSDAPTVLVVTDGSTQSMSECDPHDKHPVSSRPASDNSQGQWKPYIANTPRPVDATQ